MPCCTASSTARGVGANLGLVLWALGYADQACSTSTGARPGPDVAHPNTLQYALTFTAIGHHFRREARDVQSRPRWPLP